MRDYLFRYPMLIAAALLSISRGAISKETSYDIEADPLLNKSACASFECLISKEEINDKLDEVAHLIDQDLKGEEVTIVMILKGAVFLAVDLMRKLQSPCTLEWVRASSYGVKGKERGELTVAGLEKLDISGKNVLVVEDVFDSGMTLSRVVEKISELGPKTLKSVVLLSKKISRQTEYRPDYILFEIENRFIVGYGLDYKERWRELSGIYAVD